MYKTRHHHHHHHHHHHFFTRDTNSTATSNITAHSIGKATAAAVAAAYKLHRATVLTQCHKSPSRHTVTTTPTTTYTHLYYIVHTGKDELQHRLYCILVAVMTMYASKSTSDQWQEGWLLAEFWVARARGCVQCIVSTKQLQEKANN